MKANELLHESKAGPIILYFIFTKQLF